VAELLMKQGDRVQTGQVIAILDSRDRLQSALREAQEQVRVAQSQLAQVKAGAKAGEIQAQKAIITKLQAELQGEIVTLEATIARWKSEVSNASAEYNRFQSLYKERVISVSDLDRKRLVLETTQAQLKEASAQRNRTVQTLQAQISEARATLNRITEVRPVDVQAAQAEIEKAIAMMERAKTELNQAYIRAPIAGQILKIHTRPGEKLTDAGVADLGQTNDMAVIAEVYQTDITKVRVGQLATITSQAFPGEVKGTVYEVGLEVRQQNVFSTQPGENLDRRVIEVKIYLSPEESKRVASLTNLQVQVAIKV
jgi:HlyD family secretion protein